MHITTKQLYRNEYTEDIHFQLINEQAGDDGGVDKLTEMTLRRTCHSREPILISLDSVIINNFPSISVYIRVKKYN